MVLLAGQYDATGPGFASEHSGAPHDSVGALAGWKTEPSTPTSGGATSSVPSASPVVGALPPSAVSFNGKSPLRSVISAMSILPHCAAPEVKPIWKALMRSS